MTARIWPLFVLATTWYAVYRVFLHHDFTPREDAYLLTGIGAVYVVAVAYMLVYTRRWELKSLGQVATYASDAGLYLGAGGPALGWWSPFGPNWITGVRAGFVVGGLLLVLGLIWWDVRRRRGHVDPEWDGEERRSGFERRKEWTTL